MKTFVNGPEEDEFNQENTLASENGYTHHHDLSDGSEFMSEDLRMTDQPLTGEN